MDKVDAFGVLQFIRGADEPARRRACQGSGLAPARLVQFGRCRTSFARYKLNCFYGISLLPVRRLGTRLRALSRRA